MEKKLIVLVLCGLLGGLAGGYGLGYVIYQPQIQNIQDDLMNLSNEFASINSSLIDTHTSMASLEDEADTLRTDVTSLEDEMDTLGSDLANLNSTVKVAENRTWHEVYSAAASSDMASGTFQLKGSEVKISWFGLSDYTDAWLEIDLCFSNGTVYSLWASSGVYVAMDAEIFLRQAGDYYLGIYTYQTDYAIGLYDYY